jgi:hypothetical protein
VTELSIPRALASRATQTSKAICRAEMTISTNIKPPPQAKQPAAAAFASEGVDVAS